MQDGFYLRYVGNIEKALLFGVNNYINEDNMFYAFYYVNKNTLIVATGKGCWDIKLSNLEAFDKLPSKEETL